MGKTRADKANRRGRRVAFTMQERLGQCAGLLVATDADEYYRNLNLLVRPPYLYGNETWRVQLNDGRRAVLVVERFDTMAAPGWASLDISEFTTRRVVRPKHERGNNGST